MNKTIIININGIVFHIEEDAYEVLKSYMTDVKRHFMDSADSLEITTDIENRIAEMFSELLARDNKQVIVEQDVQAVISQMGTVADFASADEDGKTTANPDFNYTKESRRLFRDPDDHLAAGVCSGIASYFDIQAVWVRLAFAIAFCFFGSGLFLYIILWIVIPKALTRADRMAMKGEKLDLQGFARNFEYELKNVQGHVTNLHNEAKPLIYKTRDFAGDFFGHLGAFLAGAGKILLKIFAVVIMLVCLGVITALIVILFTWFAYGNYNHIASSFPFNIVKHETATPFLFGAFLLAGLPLLALTLLMARLAFNRTALSATAGYSMLVMWIASLCVVIYYSAAVAAEFRTGGRFSQTINLRAAPVYHLKLNNVRYLSSDDSARLDIKHTFAGKIILDDDDDYNGGSDDGDNEPRSVTISIERSDVPQPVLIESFSARGHDYADALMNARNTVYQFVQKDSLLIFDRHITHLARKAWRGQEVRLTLKVPLNAELVIDKDMDRYLDNVDIYNCSDRTMLEHSKTVPFIMTPEGLKCYMVKPDSTATKPDSTENQ